MLRRLLKVCQRLAMPMFDSLMAPIERVMMQRLVVLPFMTHRGSLFARRDSRSMLTVIMKLSMVH